MPASTSPDLSGFLASLAGRRSPRTIAGYGRDLAACSAWCAQTLGWPLTLATLTQPLADESAAHLQRACRAATSNRYLAALLAFAAWGRAAGRRAGLPLQVRWQKRAPAAPRQAAPLRGWAGGEEMGRNGYQGGIDFSALFAQNEQGAHLKGAAI